MDTNGKLMKMNDKGIAAVYLALILVALVALAGIAIDFSYMYIAKGQLQNAADASALAGASRLNGTVFANQTGARNEAWRFACNNKMVPAGKSVFLIASSSYSSPPSDLNSGNDPDGDIILGHWYGPGDFRPRPGVPLPTGEIINAVKVVARRTSDSANPPIRIGGNPMSTFLGRVIGWNQMNVAAEAIAAKTPAKVLPIAVNEYWLADSTLASKRPYDDSVHAYPNSFTRQVNVNGTTSTAFGRVFGIMGSYAEDNMGATTGGSRNLNGYVYVDARTSNHNGAPGTWYQVNTTATGSFDCSICPSWFTGPGDWDPNTGNINSQKFNDSLMYLANGYPDNLVLPTAVKEVYRSTYTAPNYAEDPTSYCPYATVSYFSSSGSKPLTIQISASQYFKDYYPPGSKVITMVYDGTFYYIDASSPNAVTNVGYVALQIDGYATQNSKSLGNPNFFKTNGNENGSTVYAHALESMIEPDSIVGQCSADFFNRLMLLRYKYGPVKLVK